MLLPPKLNSKLQNKRPKDKIDAYRKTGLLIASQVAEVIEEDGWTPKTVQEREQAILGWAGTEWAD